MKKTVQQWLNECSSDQLREPFESEGNITMGFVVYSESEEMFHIREQGMKERIYSMKADRLLSKSGLLDFLFQIHAKPWITSQHIKDFLDCLTCYTHREHGKLPQDFYDVVGGMNKGLDSVE